MSKQLTLEFPDELYEVFEKIAVRDGRPTEAVAFEYAARHALHTPPKLTEAEREAALALLLRHAGVGNSGNARSGDNEQIDADLALEHESSHED